jgi:hypothetical protein
VGCEKKQRLLDEYNGAVSAWAKAIQRLKEQAEMDPESYLTLRKRVEEARSETHLAETAYTKHLEAHGC